MAEESNIKTPEEVREEFTEKQEKVDDTAFIEINEDLVRMNQKIVDLERLTEEALNATIALNGVAREQQVAVDANMKDIDGVVSALKNAQGSELITIEVGADGALKILGRFTGVVYMSGMKFEDLNLDATKPWVKVDLANSTVTEDAGPPSNPFPPAEEWYEKSKHIGDIHVTRL